jgi:hypothetical protein
MSLVVSCKQAVSCAEDAVQVRRRRRCYGPASDAEFLRSIADKTPGRDDDDQRRRRQVYLKSYAFATTEEAEAKQVSRWRGGRVVVDAVLPAMLLRRRRRKTRSDDGRMVGGASYATRSSSSSKVQTTATSSARKPGKVLSQMLTRLLLSCACNPAPASLVSTTAA